MVKVKFYKKWNELKQEEQIRVEDDFRRYMKKPVEDDTELKDYYYVNESKYNFTKIVDYPEDVINVSKLLSKFVKDKEKLDRFWSEDFNDEQIEELRLAILKVYKMSGSNDYIASIIAEGDLV